MPVKLIACDLDGTLLGADHITVSQRTVKALADAHEKGMKIAVATGRTLSVIYKRDGTDPVSGLRDLFKRRGGV